MSDNRTHFTEQKVVEQDKDKIYTANEVLSPPLAGRKLHYRRESICSWRHEAKSCQLLLLGQAPVEVNLRGRRCPRSPGDGWKMQIYVIRSLCWFLMVRAAAFQFESVAVSAEFSEDISLSALSPKALSISCLGHKIWQGNASSLSGYAHRAETIFLPEKMRNRNKNGRRVWEIVSRWERGKKVRAPTQKSKGEEWRKSFWNARWFFLAQLSVSRRSEASVNVIKSWSDWYVKDSHSSFDDSRLEEEGAVKENRFVIFKKSSLETRGKRLYFCSPPLRLEYNLLKKLYRITLSRERKIGWMLRLSIACCMLLHFHHCKSAPRIFKCTPYLCTIIYGKERNNCIS